jgi:2-iminobutanoate/2-iminopropanoate deaminase
MSQHADILPVSTPDAPTPAGHYSQGIVHAGLVYVSGQLPIDPATREHVKGSVEAQTERVLENVAAVVRAAGSDPSRILRLTVYVDDVSTWGRVNETCARFFGEHRPARAVVPSPGLHHGFALEVEAVAALP